jgi:hypothetical protein
VIDARPVGLAPVDLANPLGPQALQEFRQTNAWIERLVRARRRLSLITKLKLFSFFGFGDARISQFVSQSVFQISGRARQICDANRMIPMVIQGDLYFGKCASGTFGVASSAQCRDAFNA